MKIRPDKFLTGPAKIPGWNSLPSPEQLTMVAASLAQHSTEPDDKIMDRALDLFLLARKRLWFASRGREINFQNAYLETLHLRPFAAYAGLTYPLERDGFLAWALPQYKSRTSDLARAAKSYLEDTLREQIKRKPTEGEISDAYANWKPCENELEVARSGHAFREWYRKYISKLRGEAGGKTAKKGKAAGEKKAKKSEVQTKLPGKKQRSDGL